MTGKIGRKKVLKFRDFPTRLHGEVFFVENGYDEKLNLSIINHLLDINNLFIGKSIHFNYFPFLGPHIRKTALYSYPAMNKEDLNISVPSDLLLSQLVEEKNKEKLHPSILQLDHEEDGIYYVNSYSLSIEEDEDFMPLMQAAYDKLPDCNVMFSSVDDFPYSIFDPKPIPADETFSYDIRQKMKEVYRQVQDLRLGGVSDWVLKQYLFPPKNLSRMVITENYDIILPDYHDMTIKMEPLVKAVYILFLRHEEGILFKCLSDYREELYDIYVDIRKKSNNNGAHLSEEKIRQSIEALTNPLSNSINEKCARIRQAFTLQFDESLAGSYFIDGNRGEPKRYHWIESLWSGNKTRNPPCSTSQQGGLFLFIYTKAGYRNLAVYSVWVANHDTVFTRLFDVGIY